MYKKIILSIVLTTSLMADIKKDISFLGYKLYSLNYVKNGKEEKIKLTYNIHIEKEKNNKKLFEKFTENNVLSVADKKKLEEWMSKTIDTEKGFTYEVIVNNKSTLIMNGKQVLVFDDNGDFGKKFLRIWTGNNPVDDDLKKEIFLAYN